MPQNDEPIPGPPGLLETIREVRRAGRASPSLIAARQQARLQGIVAFARDHSRFYSRRYHGVPTGTPNLHSLPPVSKPELMASFDDWVTDPEVTRSDVDDFVAEPALIGRLLHDRYAVWTTSGTTGDPGIFLHDRTALRVYASLAIVRGIRAWIDSKAIGTFLRRGVRVAAVIATGGHFASAAVEELVSSLHPAVARRLRVFSVLTPLPEMVQALNEFQPTILVGYSTAVALLAQKQIAGELRMRPGLIITTAEWLAPAARDQIRKGFGRPARDLYAASEFLGIAYSCAQGQLHVNADWVILEPVDEAYRPVPAGHASHTVLLTNLANHVQPIIRYDIGDSVTVVPDRCSSGSPLPVIQVQGRQDEILELAAPEGKRVPILPMALETVVEEVPGVQRYQIIQTAPAVLSVRIEAAPGIESRHVRAAASKSLREYLKAQGLPSVRIEQASEPPTRDPVTGKFRQVWADLRHDRSSRQDTDALHRG